MLPRWAQSSYGTGLLDTLETRMELWDRAVYMLQDFPFTGIGLGQFSPVLHALYVPLLVPPGQFVPHAHNLYLEYALELGIPGAVAFALVVLAFFRQCARAARSADPLLRWTGLGLALGVFGFLVYGLADAIAPGARAGLVLWLLLGLGTAVGNVARAEAHPPVVGVRDRNPL
jgi:putative inorganic carbon (HCO3(-)) transporter